MREPVESLPVPPAVPARPVLGYARRLPGTGRVYTPLILGSLQVLGSVSLFWASVAFTDDIESMDTVVVLAWAGFGVASVAAAVAGVSLLRFRHTGPRSILVTQFISCACDLPVVAAGLALAAAAHHTGGFLTELVIAIGLGIAAGGLLLAGTSVAAVLYVRRYHRAPVRGA